MKKLCLFVHLFISLNLFAVIHGPKKIEGYNVDSTEHKKENNINKNTTVPEHKKIVNGNPVWQAIGSYIMDRVPENVTNSSDLNKTRYLVSQVTKIINQVGYEPSYTRSHRIDRPRVSGYGSGLKCSDISNILYDAIIGGSKKGININAGNVLDIIVEKDSAMSKITLDPNRNHVATCVVIDNQIYAFDPWQSGSQNDTYEGFSMKNKWNGMPFDTWVKEMGKQGYKTMCYDGSGDNFYSLNKASEVVKKMLIKKNKASASSDIKKIDEEGIVFSSGSFYQQHLKNKKQWKGPIIKIKKLAPERWSAQWADGEKGAPWNIIISLSKDNIRIDEHHSNQVWIGKFKRTGNNLVASGKERGGAFSFQVELR